jgi:hypothetical protein
VPAVQERHEPGQGRAVAVHEVVREQPDGLRRQGEPEHVGGSVQARDSNRVQSFLVDPNRETKAQSARERLYGNRARTATQVTNVIQRGTPRAAIGPIRAPDASMRRVSPCRVARR